MNTRLRKPSFAALLVGLVPFVAICFSVPLWDRLAPMVLGLPFNIFWLVLWTMLTPLCLWVAYALETAAESRANSCAGDVQAGQGGMR